VFTLVYVESALRALKKMDKSVQFRLAKKLRQLERPDLRWRHLRHGLPHEVAEVSGYRIAFLTNDALKTRVVDFIGTHKQYELWFKQAQAELSDSEG
jgi:hypothetical protein